MLRPSLFETVALLIAALIISYQLFIPPAIGMADNGDFIRVMTLSGLDHLPTEFEEKYFLYFNSKFRILAKRGSGRYRTSTEIPARAARWLSIRLIDGRIFDIRLLGGLYALLFLSGFYLLLRASRPLAFWSRIALAILLTLILTDAGYTGSFNSFYSEPTAFVFFLLASGCALLLIARRRSVWLLVAYFVVSVIFITSKPAYAPFAILFGAFGIYLARLVEFKKPMLLSGALATLLCVIAAIYYSSTPDWLRLNALYIGVFTVTLKDSPTPEQDLIDMGLDPDWARFSGTNPYRVDSPTKDSAFRSELMTRAGAMTVPGFYLARPARLFALVRSCSSRILSLPRHFGFYEKSSGRPPRSQPSALWSEIRNFLFPKSVWTVLIFFASGIAATAIGILRATTETRRNLFVFCGFLITVAFAQFFIPVLTLGHVDLARYLILFNLIFDSSLIMITVAVAERFTNRTLLPEMPPSARASPDLPDSNSLLRIRV